MRNDLMTVSSPCPIVYISPCCGLPPSGVGDLTIRCLGCALSLPCHLPGAVGTWQMAGKAESAADLLVVTEFSLLVPIILPTPLIRRIPPLSLSIDISLFSSPRGLLSASWVLGTTDESHSV